MKGRILSVIFTLLLIIFFALYAIFAYRYTDFIQKPGTIYHNCQEQHMGAELSTHHEKKSHAELGTRKKKHHAHGELDYTHIRILNHPWNNFAMIIMIFVQGLFYMILGFLLWKKTFYE